MPTQLNPTQFKKKAQRNSLACVRAIQAYGPEMILAQSSSRLIKLRKLDAPAIIIMNDERRVEDMKRFIQDGPEAFRQFLIDSWVKSGCISWPHQNRLTGPW